MITALYRLLTFPIYCLSLLWEWWHFKPSQWILRRLRAFRKGYNNTSWLVGEK